MINSRTSTLHVAASLTDRAAFSVQTLIAQARPRPLRWARALVLACVALLLCGVEARAQSALDGFDPGANNIVRTLAVQPDGKILVGGDFTTLGGGGNGTTTRNYIGRLNADGSLDTTFDPGANSAVVALAVQPDGKILVGGDFTTLGGGGTGTTTRNYLARLNADGSLDTTFNPGADNFVYALAVQADGKIVVGGQFTGLGGGTGTTTRNRIGRLNPDGSLDTTSNPGADGTVIALAMQPDGKILVGGAFTTLGGGGFGTTTRNYIARLNPDGSLDTSFNPGANSFVYALAVQADGKIVVGGAFTTLGGGGFGTTTRNLIGRLNVDGSLDTSFNPGANFTVLALAVQADGKIVVGGQFSTLGGGGFGTTTRYRIGRLNPDGSLDTSFNPGADSDVYALAVQADGKIVVGGQFSTLGGGGMGTTTRNRIGRLNADGSLDTTFNPGANNNVLALAVQADGKILVGGDFTMLGGGGTGTTPRESIGRLNPDGSLDTTFNPGANGEVIALAVQADGKILVGGFFFMLGGGGTGTTPRNGIGRLNPDGSLDMTFNPGVDSGVYALAVQADGKILVGGSFGGLGGGTGTTPRESIGRLNPDGSLDTTFNPGADGAVSALAVQTDGKILVGGYFTMLGGGGTGTTTRSRIGRLNADGSLDTSFNPGANDTVLALAVQADRKILVGGDFTGLGGGTGTTTRNKIGRLNPDGSLDTSFDPGTNITVLALAVQADGKIVVGGQFTTLGGGGTGTTTRNRIGRLNADGSLDTTFNPGANGSVLALAVQADGKILVGGVFTMLGGGGTGTTTRNRIGRLTNTDAALQNLTVSFSGTSVRWLRSGASPELERVTFELSTNGSTYTPLGNGTRILGGWLLTSLSLPAQQNIYVRARGFYHTGFTTGSYSVVESIRNAYITIPQAANGTLFDFDGDKRADVSIWNPNNHNWYILQSTDNITRVQLDWGSGALGDISVPADYDGDGHCDIAVYRPSEGNFYVIRSMTNTVGVRNWGGGSDIPVPADYDGDGKADYAVFRPSEGNWYIINSATNTVTLRGWGASSDKPVAADYDADGKADIAVWRPSEGNWYIINSRDQSVTLRNWGTSTDRVVPADYDGDGRADLAVFRGAGNWYILNSATSLVTVKNWGNGSDIPVAADYDGDGLADIAVFRPTEGNWYIIRSAANTVGLFYLGGSGDVPAPSTSVR